MGVLERMYRSPFGRVMSMVANMAAFIHKPFMVYGYFDRPSGRFYKYTRISSTVSIMNPKALKLGDHIWVWHYSILDATEGLTIEEGCQIGAWVGIFTHGSESSIRLLGPQFVHIKNNQRKGYTRGTVHIGAYSFVGAGSVILPGVTIGKGCLIGTGTLVNKDIPEYSIAIGRPAQVKGSTIDLDRKAFDKYDFSKTYYDSFALEEIKERIHSSRVEKKVSSL